MLISLTTGLFGCSYHSNGTVTTSNEGVDVNYSLTGIPILLGASGSTVPIAANISITAAHVAKYSYDKVIAYHPTCDIALVYSDNSDKVIPQAGYVYPNQYILNIGRSVLGSLVKSEGKYLIDYHFENYYPGCFTSISTAALQSGMSGGGAYNESRQLVGINFAIIKHVNTDDESYAMVNEAERRSAFVALPFISEWVKLETGIVLYASE
ncbi:serine protease [Vibrio europaeus]|uniref:serine protease n=1 Tax=Vibrio europaeus TaxID=300876 RepID=UPI0018A6F0CD|nr:serine protease [Vibrio europaeus]MDC5812463.1 serine protease [Vibrio europaeus]QPG33890.1 serine protease [Vibrio europaeus]